MNIGTFNIGDLIVWEKNLIMGRGWLMIYDKQTVERKILSHTYEEVQYKIIAECEKLKGLIFVDHTILKNVLMSYTVIVSRQGSYKSP